ncbi:VWA domain-containing protein [Weeksellaceae bacterium TAE3-ERU29]|nr:VWA domain-containing protein [Weeksellaceae bacterium TAE3-ERU29]
MTFLEFVNPWFLLLLLLIPAMVAWLFYLKNKKQQSLGVPSINAFGRTADWYSKIPVFLYAIRMLALALLIIAFARPRKVDVTTYTKSEEGVDIMMVVDISLSMLARDLKPNRLEALKKVAENFVSKRLSDRIGIVVYSGDAVTQVPLTADKTVLENTIHNLGTMEGLEPGTAIGVGLATAINHLEHSKAKSKVVLLITDGGESPVDFSSNRTYISPEEAAEVAKERGIKVYTIGIGTTGFVPPPIGKEYYPQHLFKLDENLLKYIADKANGVYFRATDNEKLKSIYNEIDGLEKSKISEKKYYNYSEYYRLFVIWAFILLLLDTVARTLIFKRVI